MLFRVFLLLTVLTVVTYAAEPAARKPCKKIFFFNISNSDQFNILYPLTNETFTLSAPCREGTQYMKDCNVCTCGAPGKKDKCGTVDCNRYKGTTARSNSTFFCKY